MAYIISLTNGHLEKFPSLADVKDWLKDNDYVTEPNAQIWGIDTTISEQGAVSIYENGNGSDYTDGRIGRTW